MWLFTAFCFNHRYAWLTVKCNNKKTTGGQLEAKELEKCFSINIQLLPISILIFKYQKKIKIRAPCSVTGLMRVTVLPHSFLMRAINYLSRSHNKETPFCFTSQFTVLISTAYLKKKNWSPSRVLHDSLIL